MLPLDCTHKALTSAKRVAAIRALGTRVGARDRRDWLDFFERFDEQKYGTDGGPLHDPCVIAYLLKPDLFNGRQVNVAVETQSELTMGMTVIDWWGVTDRPKNALVMGDVDADGLLRPDHRADRAALRTRRTAWLAFLAEPPILGALIPLEPGP